MPKGARLVAGQIAILSLDGTLVYVESTHDQYTAVVALPEQPATRKDERVFTPGKVGSKKISAFAEYEELIDVGALSQRNREFIGTYEVLRTQHGPHFVDRTPEEEAALNAPRVKPAKVKKEKKVRPPRGPRYLSICEQCGQQPGHPNHPIDHEFKAKIDDAPQVKTRQPREKKERTPRGPGRPSVRKDAVDVMHRFEWIGTDDQLAALAAGNPKYKPGNSGGDIVDILTTNPPPEGMSVVDMLERLASHPKWSAISIERLQVAFTQMVGAKVLKDTGNLSAAPPEATVTVVASSDGTVEVTSDITHDPILEALRETVAALKEAAKTIGEQPCKPSIDALALAIDECSHIEEPDDLEDVPVLEAIQEALSAVKDAEKHLPAGTCDAVKQLLDDAATACAEFIGGVDDEDEEEESTNVAV